MSCGGLADEDEATVRVLDVELGHAVFPFEQLPDSVTVGEGFDVCPEGVNAVDLDVDFDVVAGAWAEIDPASAETMSNPMSRPVISHLLRPRLSSTGFIDITHRGF